MDSVTEPPASGAALRVAGPSSPWPVPSRGLLVVIGVAAVVLQSVIQPRVVGTTVGLSGTLSFLSLLIWTSILGGVGALLAVPASLFVKALFIDVDPDRRWLTPLLSSSAASQQPDDPVAGESPPPADPPPHVLDNPEGSRR